MTVRASRDRPFAFGACAFAAALVGLSCGAFASASERLDPTDVPFALDVPYVATPEPVVARMLALAEVGADDFVIDLGSGDGRIVIAAARDRGARALGVERDRALLAKARKNAAAAGVADRATFREQDLFETDLTRASVVTLFLNPRVNLELRPRLLESLRPGARVVSHIFRMGDWQPDADAHLMDRDVHLWVVPARVAGRWRLETPDGPLDLRLAQSFQRIEGTAAIDGRELPLAEAELKGAAIRFAIEGEGEGEGGRRVFTGRVAGDVMSAVPAPGEPDAVAGWRAVRK